MNTAIDDLRSRGGNQTKRCTECDKMISKYSHNICLECENENKNKGNKPLAPYPTNALPGSPRKILVLSWRAYKGYSLWHPRDLRRDYLNLKEWLSPDPKQEEFEQKVLLEIKQILIDLEKKRKEDFKIKQAAMLHKQRFKI